LAAEVTREYPTAEIRMQPSSGGRFEVFLDEKPVFEKSKLGRHAQPGEVLALIRKALADNQRGA
jgi:selT/selW/selH-like putative selenoprotein